MFLEKVQQEISLKNKLVIGFELNNDFSQISYSTFEQSTPETLSLIAGAEEYEIPTALLAVRNEVSPGEYKISWSVGRDIRNRANETDSFLIDDFFELIKSDSSVIVGSEEFLPGEILEIYVKKCLSYLIAIGRKEEIAGICFVSGLSSKIMAETFKEKFTQIPVFFIDKEECFFQYILHQPSLNKVQDCLLFELGDGLTTYRLEINQNTKPKVGLAKKYFYEEIKKETDMSEIRMKAYDSQMVEIINEVSQEREIASSFLIGDGFSKEWCKDSIRLLCKKGRVFQGNNLYSKGACFYAKEKINPSTLALEYAFLSEDKLKINVGMNVTDRGEDKYLAMLHAGYDWKEAKYHREFFLGYDNSMRLIITNLETGKEQTADIALNHFQIRKNHTNKIDFSLEMKNPYTLHIEVRDLGFGEIFPSKGTVWKEDVQIK